MDAGNETARNRNGDEDVEKGDGGEMSGKTPAQAAHDAWCGDDDWAELNDEERGAWDDAAQAAIAMTERERDAARADAREMRHLNASQGARIHDLLAERDRLTERIAELVSEGNQLRADLREAQHCGTVRGEIITEILGPAVFKHTAAGNWSALITNAERFGFLERAGLAADVRDAGS
jgi:hypothetical protein